MITGTVFDIKEFAVYDGPGVRVTVFLKGCPMRCSWCHNPEGLGRAPQIMVSAACVECGACRVSDCSLNTGGECSGCGRCAELCPNGYRKVSGELYTPESLASRIMTYERFFRPEGGVTFSGGEPTLQSDFLCATLELLPIHRAIQTCGFCPEAEFRRVLERVEFVFFDIKHTEREKHKYYTGADNAPILRNLEILKSSGKPFVARVPLISGVNDDAVNLRKTAELLADSEALLRVELLPYNGAAGAKYKMVGLPFPHSFRSPETAKPEIFAEYGIECKVM